jgi:predicted HicB family RNase H-like nuclease
MSKENKSTPVPQKEEKQETDSPQRDTRVRVNVRVPSRLMKLIKEEAIYNDRSVSSMVIEALWEKYRKDESTSE